MAVVACVSLTTVENTEENLKMFEHYIDQAAEKNTDLIVFPEYSLQGVVDMTIVDPLELEYYHSVAEYVPEGSSTQRMIQKAKEKDMYIAWTMVEKDKNQIDILYNTMVLVGPEGYVGSYRKIHLPLTERLYVFPGNEVKVFDTKLGKIGLMICFDLSYPETARMLALKGAELIICATGWPKGTGEVDDQLNIYNIFNSARAVENQVYLATSTTCGEIHPGSFCAGHSRITAPDGTLLAETDYNEGIALADIDIQKGVIDARVKSMMMSNLLKDRMPHTYGELVKCNYCNVHEKQ